MLTAYTNIQGLQLHSIGPENCDLLNDAIWIDMLSPTKDEEIMVEKALNLVVPTREEMREIEVSSRLYKNKEAIFMTASMIAQSESLEPKQDAVTFVLTKKQFITIRYIQPQAFKLFIAQLYQMDSLPNGPGSLLLELLDATIDRLADTLELIGHRLEETSRMIFRPIDDGMQDKLDYRVLIQQIGINADLNTKARECLVSFSRLILFFSQSAGLTIDTEDHARLGSLSKDIASLSDHANFISSKVNFLLDATMGLINIEQNAIIKIFSVAAVIFLPPTLIASIYGMNFESMPELRYKWGYFIALALMILSAVIPYKFFKWKKWM